MPAVTFTASLHRTTTDAEGETTITFKVPLTDLPALVRLGLLRQMELTVTIEAQAT